MKGEPVETAVDPGKEAVNTWVTADGVWHAQPLGEIDEFTSPELRQKLFEALSQNQVSGIEVDMSKTTFVDSSFLGVVVSAAMYAKSQELPMGLVGMNNRNIRKIIDDLGLDPVLPYLDETESRDPEVIKQWAESYGAKPALLEHSTLEGEMLAFMFPGQEQDWRYREISWEQFFGWLHGNRVIFQLRPPPDIRHPFYEIMETEDMD